MSTPQNPGQPTEWLVPTAPAQAPGDATSLPAAKPRSTSVRRGAMAAALLAVGVVIGGGVGYAAAHHDSGPTTTTPATSNALSGGPNGAAGPAPSGVGGPGGSAVGEQRLQGTIAGQAASAVTIKTSSGTHRYAVTSATQIVRDGQTATLSQLKVGDAVLVHLIPASSGSGMVVERLFAGTSATDTGPGGFGPPGDGTGGFGPGNTGVTGQDT